MKRPKVNLIRWDSADLKEKIAALARQRGRSVNRLVNEWAQIILAQEQAEASFRAAASRGNPKRLLRLLDRLDAEDRRRGLAGSKP